MRLNNLVYIIDLTFLFWNCTEDSNEADVENYNKIILQNAALVCNLENEIGTIEEGKIADLIIVEGNLLENLDLLTGLKYVIHNGHIIKEY